MPSYKMLSGEIHRDKFEILLPKHIRTHLEKLCRAEWSALHAIDMDNTSASAYIAIDVLKKSIEGRIHWYIVEAQFPLDPLTLQPWQVALTSAELNALMAAVQTQGRGPRGTRQRFRDGYNSITAYRRFRSWWLARELAERYSLPFAEACPVEAILPATPTFESIITNFEEWTGYLVAPKMRAMAKEMYDDFIARKEAEATQNTQLAA